MEMLQVKGLLCMIDLIRALGKMALKTTSTKVSTYVELVGPQGALPMKNYIMQVLSPILCVMCIHRIIEQHVIKISIIKPLLNQEHILHKHVT